MRGGRLCLLWLRFFSYGEASATAEGAVWRVIEVVTTSIGILFKLVLTRRWTQGWNGEKKTEC